MRRQASLALLNTLSLTRLPLAVAFILVPDAWVRAGLVVLAAFTDFLDGWIARHKGLATRLGALIDPVADRAFMVTAILVCYLDGLISGVAVLLLVLRDVGTTVGFFVARLAPRLRSVELKARMMGKAVTSLQLVTLLCVLLFPPAVVPLVALIGVLSFASMVDYSHAVLKARQRDAGPRRMKPESGGATSSGSSLPPVRK
ncbi:CDP-alcohol phosphatidyltransferase family protein [Myxococcus xanthus DK 1622]|uniref:CDP-diacylglycerol--glycerol-3-phosphate 3-phosphatidyltransferase n=1 Tax=Myxococcus xanthus (strain DK1622) TaxID=246197 RepID=Q1CW08_MYXXD|nr:MULTISPECIES: CDP-alcohol phosphatidyltransferase family protein [Myxococcus]ABF88187.1 CDP-alcohol phosphatidyltransferase family protein [Myxococcus xanthus DK 1622]NOJ51751.1 CDP-alcohol phosphatidyltransferase family protein [Myxococcus xanthus]QPM79551.1 CDP-alcohol phosphatidyltransferase family protein [Myxococcus xanthus]QVW68631.1 CDP-alcohol phosphatidyltransferase family protein [Myxococcus xanthus DZ2]QZZ54902.1 CDP-diacylglycerol--glycerol-3-phosphate 3-phosphatidyltransferase 